MKTNFERWKEGLTPDSDAIKFGIAGVDCKANCPAYQYCLTKRTKKNPFNMFKEDWTCFRVFTTWAKKFAKEDE